MQRPLSPSLLPRNIRGTPEYAAKQAAKQAKQTKDLPPKLAALIDPELQVYIHKAPGKGFGVVYVQISPSGKMYVGQMNHGSGCCAQTFWAQRRNKAAKTKRGGCPAIRNAFKKYGEHNIRSFILVRCPAGRRDREVKGDTNDMERHFISPQGLDTLHPNGYNLTEGGLNGNHSLISRARMSTSQSRRRANMSKDEKDAHVVSSREAKVRAYADPMRGPQYRNRLSTAATNSNNAIMEDEARRTARREARTATRARKQILADAKKWIPLMAAASDEAACREVLNRYEKAVKRRIVQQNRRARRGNYGNPPPPMSRKEASALGRQAIARDIDRVVAKMKATRGY